MNHAINIRSVITIAFASALISCNNHPSPSPGMGNKSHGNIVAETFKENGGWGYRVFINDKLFIKQSIIPVVEGNKCFTKEEDAIKVASLVVDKMRRHQQPTIQLDELKEIGIVKR